MYQFLVQKVSAVRRKKLEKRQCRIHVYIELTDHSLLSLLSAPQARGNWTDGRIYDCTIGTDIVACFIQRRGTALSDAHYRRC